MILLINIVIIIVVIIIIIIIISSSSSSTGVCKINARSKTIRHETQPPFPQCSMLTK